MSATTFYQWVRRAVHGDDGIAAAPNELPLRAELFGTAQLESHAVTLAADHDISDRPGPEQLLNRLDDNAARIQDAYERVADSAARGYSVAPAAEWLLDNFYLIEEQIEVARELLPANYSRELPRLRLGPQRGFPRVYDLALELVSHTDGRVDVDNLSAFIAAYQRVTPLRMGELWALPIMLRLALLENLRRVAQRISARRQDQDAALHWVGRFQSVAHENPRHLITELSEFVRADLPLTKPLVCEMVAQLLGQHEGLGLVTNWLDHELAEQGQTIDQIMQAESQEQASDQISVGNAISSLRHLNTYDWRTFVEAQSATEAILRTDPAGIYATMDFATRDRYRHHVEHLARRSANSEVAVSHEVVRAAGESAAVHGAEAKASHIGYYLVDRGRSALEARLGYRAPVTVRLRRFLERHALSAYLLTVTGGVCGLAGILSVTLGGVRALPPIAIIGLALLLILTLSRPAITMVNWVVTLLMPPKSLPRMDFEEGIPDAWRTAVVIPTMLTSPGAVAEVLDALQIHYLANRDKNLRLVLLTDFADAPVEHAAGDAELLAAGETGIRALNNTYAGPAGGDMFFLLHRSRLWNAGERCWMGHERKRGKLGDFNRFLFNGTRDPFATIVGDAARLAGVRLVITLDTDTQLPPGSAWRLIGTLAHPLNRPVLHPVTGKVIEGYGVLQPRVSVSLEAAARSPYARLLAGEVGVDPYTREVSNVYHDLFGCGQFVGKGIYDVQAFETAVGHRFPENTILSHDLIEGCFARCGFVDDVELIEDHPARFLADVSRRQRWIRGDWQVVPWLRRRVPSLHARRVKNPLGHLEQWLIFDNLRRSLVPAASLLCILAAWVSPLRAPGLYLSILLLLWLSPDILRTLVALVRKPKRRPIPTHVRHIMTGELRQLATTALELATLPFVAVENISSVAKAFWRRWISGRRLLEWRTAHDAERDARPGVLSTVLELRWNYFIALCAVIMPLWMSRMPGISLIPFLVAWMAAPLIAWGLSQPTRVHAVRFTGQQEALLRRIARRTWAYYDDLVTASDCWLPPDNYQEIPTPRLARRTSPTNIGMALLSTLSAHDFGYISAGQLVVRIGNTFDTLENLERHRGHFFNWYSTRDGQPLQPRYVSTVDSGNLIAHLLTLRGGLEEIPNQPILPSRWREGLTDAVAVLQDELLTTDAADRPEQQRTVESVLTAFAARLQAQSGRLSEIASILADCSSMSDQAASLLAPDTEAGRWAAALQHQCADLHTDLLYLAPWLALGLPAEPIAHLEAMPTLATLATLAPETASSKALAAAMHAAADRAAERLAITADLTRRIDDLADADLEFLYDAKRKIFLIGYHVDSHRFDAGGYDLFASEARLISYVAVACGKVPAEHWFLLGRQVAPGQGPLALISWSGSMFEYLMPLLVMPTFAGTLLDRAMRGAVLRQMRYGHQQGVPWGVSESCYNQVDRDRTYQYRAFGVPELGLKRGLAEDLVIAPYASAMGLMLLPEASIANLERMAQLGFIGRYGLYEAVDYTPNRLPAEDKHVVVQTFMAHHCGMSLLSIAYVLLGLPMQRRFLRNPELRASTLLLQERVPITGPVERHTVRLPERAESADDAARREAVMRVFYQQDLHNPVPDVHLLSNSRYMTMVTTAGSGFSRWQDLAVTRWREDAARESWGTFIYLKDVESDKSWSATYEPMLRSYDQYEAVFSQARAEFRCTYQQIESQVEMAVSPEDDIELRRITLVNRTGRTRTIELTSYGELVLLEPRAEMSHPAFNNLFVQTEIVPGARAILGTRRPRSHEEKPPFLVHMLLQRGDGAYGEVSFETDRMRFIGRNRTVADPAALLKAGPLSNTAGAVLDPVFAVRRRVVLKPGAVARFDLITGVAPTREQAITLVDRYHDERLTDRVFELAWTHSQVLLHQLRASESSAEVFATLAGSMIYNNPPFRANASLLARNRKGQSGLWSYGISGDLPIALMRVSDHSGIDLVREAIQAHAYWRQKGLRNDLIIWTDAYAGYRQSLFDEVISLVNATTESKVLDQPGGIFVRTSDQLPEEDRVLIQAVARVILNDRAGTFAEQVLRRGRLRRLLPPPRSVRKIEPISSEATLPPRELVFFNGLGGYTADGREYVTILAPGAHTPAPWSNVIASATFGTVVTEYGSAYTWFENAHEFRLTPWHNDPVSDTCGEAHYLRDEDTGYVWSPTPGPVRGLTPYVCRHGLGYSVWEHFEQEIHSETWVYVATDAPAKFCSIRLHNRSGRVRRISLTGYCEWVLGEMRARSAPHVVSVLDPLTGALFVRNVFNHDFPGRVAFFHCSESDRSYTADRQEFLGRHGSTANPEAMRRQTLSNKVSAGVDPCAAIQTVVELRPDQEYEVIFLLGAAGSENEARAIVQRFLGADSARLALESVWTMWHRLIGGLNVQTPDPSINFLVNHWLLYQVLACRFWGRSGYYQSGGAFGFRDQLQDSMAFLHECPWLTREHLLLAATRQFSAGDVQHWWHPPQGRGVRTHFSDDYLWLPLAIARYINGTGDTGVLDEQLPFLEGRPLRPEEESAYDLPTASEQLASLYEHAVRAIRRGMETGAHGLPLMGCGDWNDGMNRVGIGGKGESVWLAFFLFHVLEQFIPIAQQRGDDAFVAQCITHADALRTAIEANAWDGNWYRRAFFDDGTPLGSRENPECQIDLLPQSWAVLSGAAAPDRATTGMRSAHDQLVDINLRLVHLFTPPFDTAAWDPGYIKGYVPGVRENGGQYTHAAIWFAMAAAKMGDTDRAWALFDIINPVRHGDTAERIMTYRVEPYVVAADVYSLPDHAGRGGWTWYTGSASWMYRLLVESLLGVTLHVDRLHVGPLLPQTWPGFSFRYRFRDTHYHIEVVRAGSSAAGHPAIILDGAPLTSPDIPLVDDRKDHFVQVKLSP